MEYEEKILKREELYDMVWSASPLKVAKRFGLSYKALEEICRKMEIPLPTIGVRYKINSRVPLPDLSSNGLSELLVEKPSFYLPPNTPYPKSPVAEKVLNSWQETDLSIHVTEHLRSRARVILNKLMLMVMSHGLNVSVSAAGEAQVRVDNELLILSMQDEQPRATAVSKDLMLAISFGGTWTEAMRRTYPSARFRSRWQDTKCEKLEQRLELVADTIHAIHRYLKKYREERESAQESQRIVEEAFKEQQGFLKKLERQALNWHRAQNIRLYLAAVESAIKARTLKKDDHYEPWLAMCLKTISQLDPITGRWSEEAPDFTDLTRGSPWRWAKANPVPWWPVKDKKNHD